MKKYFLWLSEIFIVLLVFLVVDNYLERREVVIKADGKGYYDYLPATFIYQDLNFNYTDTLVTEYYDHKSYGSGYLKTIKNHQVNKYFPGAAILWVPFFEAGHLYALNSEYTSDGYSLPYQMAIYAAALFYLWLGLVFLRLILRLKKVPWWFIFCIQLAFALGTPILNYVHFDASFVHVYSFTLINMFVYFVFKYVAKPQKRFLLLAGLVLGLIFLVRPVNLMAILLVVFAFDSFNDLKIWCKNLLANHWKLLLGAILVFGMVISVLPIMWKLQTGDFFIWGYQGETFNFLSPTVFNFLFSSRKGLFIHTPLLGLIFGLSFFFLAKNNKFFQLASFIGVSYIIVYVLSSWWSWYYGTSFGSRPSIDYYIIFALMLASILPLIQSKIMKYLMAATMVIMIPINVIQAFQYQHYIMDWDEMTFEKFNLIKLHTADKYRGVFFQPKPNYKSTEVILQDSMSFAKPLMVGSGELKEVLDLNINEQKKMPTHVFIKMDMMIKYGESDVVVSFINQNEKRLWDKRLNCFKNLRKEKEYGTGKFYFDLPNIKETGRLVIEIQTWNDEVKINSFAIKLISKN
ncbi:MAG: hypothetical protein ACPGVC_06070 [Salibacteraceae bacterium]